MAKTVQKGKAVADVETAENLTAKEFLVQKAMAAETTRLTARTSLDVEKAKAMGQRRQRARRLRNWRRW